MYILLLRLFLIFQIEYLKVCLDCDRHEINEVIEKEKKNKIKNSHTHKRHTNRLLSKSLILCMQLCTIDMCLLLTNRRKSIKVFRLSGICTCTFIMLSF